MRILLCFVLSLLFITPTLADELRHSVIVKKAERKLHLYTNGKLEKTYAIALGTTPVGHKMKQGDRKTPEGTYYICRKNPRSQFYLSLGLSYPNKLDADSGYASGLITKRERDKIKRAIDRGDCPPWDTAIGGEIFIHGNGSTPDWTWGCVALDDTMIKELYDLLPVGTEVRIEP
ncbi:MAG TPA: L,D-transpeptidase family protein [Candidatus Kapabacteria bacterium]|nr:L,D-transpeptidase family protein [Candidatus Kapabacteria bacterium]